MSDRIFKHSLSLGLIIVLTKIGEAVKYKGDNKIHMQGDLALTNTEFGNYQKLRYWGLIAKYKDENGHHEKGFWLLTRNGALFLKNQLSIHKSIKTQDNHVIERDIEEIKISDIWKDYHQEKWQEYFEGSPIEQKQLVMSL